MKKIISIVTIIAILTSVAVFAVTNNEIIAQFVSYRVFVNGEEKTFEQPIVTINDRTYIPLRETAEALGMDVRWNESGQSITISVIEKEDNDWRDLYPYCENGLWGYMYDTGEIKVEAKYKMAAPFVEGMALVRTGTGPHMGAGFINEKGEEVIPCTYFTAYNFSDGVALVSLAEGLHDDRWSYIDKNGDLLFDKIFVLARSFSEGYAVVLKEGVGAPSPYSTIRKWSYIDKTGEFVTERTFDDAWSFKNGYARVMLDEKYGLIDKEFNQVLPCQYDELDATEVKGIYYVEENGEGRYINTKGETVEAE